MTQVKADFKFPMSKKKWLEYNSMYNRTLALAKKKIFEQSDEIRHVRRALLSACAKYYYKGGTKKDCPFTKGDKPDCECGILARACSDNVAIECWVQYALEQSK